MKLAYKAQPSLEILILRSKARREGYSVSESSPTDADELRYIDAVRAKRELRSEVSRIKPVRRRRILEQWMGVEQNFCS